MPGKLSGHWLLERPFAHRGLFGSGVPENSIAAVENAIETGFPVEIDVQVTSDGRAVVFHDWNLLRLTGRDRRVSLTTYPEITELRLQGSDASIPTLEEMLKIIGGRVPILIEIKNRRGVNQLEPAVANALSDYRGEHAVQSFNPYTLGWFRRHHPTILRGQLSCAFDTDGMAGWKKWILSQYGMNWLTAPHFISHQWHQLPSPATHFLHGLCGLPLLAWTVRSPEEMSAALRVANNVIFEDFLPAPSVWTGVQD